jgi:hypothetical protein
LVRESPVEGAASDQILNLEVAGVELPNGQRHTVQAARWNDGGNAAPVRKPGIENGFRLGDVVAQPSCNILHGDSQRPFAEREAWDLLNETVTFNENAVWAVDHYLADGLVEDEVFSAWPCSS